MGGGKEGLGGPPPFRKKGSSGSALGRHRGPQTVGVKKKKGNKKKTSIQLGPFETEPIEMKLRPHVRNTYESGSPLKLCKKKHC